MKRLTNKNFWANVTKSESGCWPWMGAISQQGYGVFFKQGAHRIAYLEKFGTIPVGHHLDHKCHNNDCPGGTDCLHRRCVNPDHLEPATPRQNVLRGLGITAINANKTYCKYGHKFTLQNTRIDKRGHRICKTCFYKWWSEWMIRTGRRKVKT